jgi:hypothetical protein
MAMRNGHHVRARAVDGAVQEALDERAPSARVAGLALQCELHDVIGGHQSRRQRARHQEAVRVLRVPHRRMAGRIEDSLVGKDAAGRRKIFEHRTLDHATRDRVGYFHGITDT